MVKKVLIVDDDQEMLLSLKNGLKKYADSFSVLTAKDGLDALAQLKKNIVSLVVTDLKMPKMDGFALLEHIMEHYPDIPVIIITGYSTPDMEKLALSGGAVGYIAKPFMLENLARNIMTTLRRESEGGTLHSVSSGIFLQLMEMEQKTCTIRLEDKQSGKKGVLFFQDGELLDARVNHLQGKPAAYKIFSWDKVTITIQNVCPKIENKIQSDLQPLILEATRLKDESQQVEDEGVQQAPEPEVPTNRTPVAKTEPSGVIGAIKQKLESKIGPRHGLENIYRDKTWDGLIEQMASVGEFFGAGKLKVGYIDRGEATDFIILPGSETVVLSVNPKCPREKIIQLLHK
jgi:CheY-like chemotaxis protein